MLLPFIQHKLAFFEQKMALEIGKTRELRMSSSPFPHVIIDHFFPEHFYRSLEKEFQSILDRGLSEEGNVHMFSRLSSYDAYSYAPDPRAFLPSNIFYSPEWLDFMVSFFPHVKRSPDTILSFHHHKVGSTDGGVHHDFARGAFTKDPLPNGVNPWFHQCKNSSESLPSPEFFHSIRSVAMLYYLNNEPWKEGDGGETGIFLSRNRDSIVEKVAPLNNRLLIFEISPKSFHGFYQNIRNERNCIVQWAYETPDTMFAKYSKEELDLWKQK